MSQSEKVRYKWGEINWRKLEISVFKLQKRIYQASQLGKIKQIHQLQRLLLKSKSAKFLSVKRVTQVNKGRKTAGVDGIKSLNDRGKLRLASDLNFSEKCMPLRRVWIPKPGKSEKRPLGIPTIADRAKQALVKLALEPEWEAKFEPNSYGFRPGRSCQDAIQAIYLSICRKNVYILDADIKGCFDNINHQALLRKLGTFNSLRRVIKSWLKAGIMENDELMPTNSGTPQGGVISPLLANIALHGLEYELKQNLQNDLFQYLKQTKGKASKIAANYSISVIRYADDFVVIHKNRKIIEKAKSFIKRWLKKIGLKLSNEKTKIRHSLRRSKIDSKVGFEFLGFEVRQYKTAVRRRGFVTLVKPSKSLQKNHAKILKKHISQGIALTQEELIKQLNRIVVGWSNYCKSVVSSKIFSKLDNYMFHRIWKWVCKRHPNKGVRWVKRKYFRNHRKNRWRFKTHDGLLLKLHSDTKIRRHIKVRGIKSPFDGDKAYWSKRLKSNCISLIYA